ncbi:hypothetical protein [Nonomuraea sp. NPDC049141]|uniref:hypothetical protein n=1 Tax=Nonomuraea sp. NPDC049141 TaxID=3155500 RepID=UPI0033CDBD61
MKRRPALFRVATTATVSFLTLLGGTGITSASSTAPTSQAASCLQIGRTYRDGNTIIGYGSISCGTGRATIEIWEQIVPGAWRTKRSATVTGPGYDQYVFYNCAGTGTHTFKAVILGSELNGNTVSKHSNQIRESC